MLKSILIHWRILCILYGSLLASIAFAVGHHLHNQKLNNTVVSTTNDLAIGTWTGVSSQKFNTAVGNTLASLFRTFLSITVTTAYCQIVWHALKARSTRLNIVDAISGILANPVGFLNLGAWKKSALLLPLATVIWLLPIAPIVTPATLTVATSPQILHDMVNVTSVDFNSLNFAFTEGLCFYNSPRYEVRKAVTAAAVPGAVLSIDAPRGQRNASYVQEFAAPALQCNNVNDSLLGEILSNVNVSSWNTSLSYGFLAWVPEVDYLLPFRPSPQSDGQVFYQLRPDTIGPFNGKALTLFVAIFPNFITPFDTYGLSKDWNYTANPTVVGCNLMNATYSLSFNWTNSIRDLNVTVMPSKNAIPYPYLIDNCTDVTSVSEIQEMDATDVSMQPLPDLNRTLVQRVAYASVMDAFTRLVIGSISQEPYDMRLAAGSRISTTNVLNTILGSTAELLPLQNITAYSSASLYPRSWPGVSVIEQTNDPPKLRTTLELLFQNATLRLMTSPLLQPDPKTPFFPPPVNVTTVVYHNLYAYSAAMLWLAYGSALLIAIVTVVAGSLAIFSSGVSYSSSFSTVLRTTSHAVVSTKISREDAVGQDPLPKHLVEATITFNHDVAGEEEAAKQLLEPKGGFELRSVSIRSEQSATW
ncbi:hypothetical protein KCV07_g5995, partial [Aureobasidium melanogenum]